MAEEVIEVQQDAPPEVTGEKAAADKPAEKPDEHASEIAALNKTIKDNQAAADKRVREAEEATKVWYDRAEKATEAAPAKTEKAEADDPLSVFDDETKTAVRSYVKQQTAGMVSAEDVDKRAQAIVTSQLTQDQLVRDFPELGDKGSDFFKKTTEHYQRLDGVAPADRLRMSVEQTELALRRDGTWKERESESDRIARIAAQAGGAGGGPSDQAGSEELDKAQSDLAANMGITKKQYIEAARKVNFQTHSA